MKVPCEKGVGPLGLESCAEIARTQRSAKEIGERLLTLLTVLASMAGGLGVVLQLATGMEIQRFAATRR
jgi:hypothetical protein